MRLSIYGSLALTCLLAVSSCTYYLGPNKLTRQFNKEPALSPMVTDYSLPSAAYPDYKPDNPLIEYWAQKPLPDLDKAPKGDIARIMLGKLTQRRDVKEVNDYLIKLKPWSHHGTQWAFHKHGDYDFNEILFCTLLYQFTDQPEVLYPETRKHVVNVLITNSGNKRALRMPGTAGLLRETENHILMGEVSRYLKNQWLHEHGDTAFRYDNARNGMEYWMVNHLKEKLNGGFYEFNANPYSGYSITALLTLFSFSHSGDVHMACFKLLNEIFYEYAISSYDQRRYPPFRRRLEREGRKNFDDDPLTSIVKVLLDVRENKPDSAIKLKHHGLMALLLHYRLTNSLALRIQGNGLRYFARYGHGPKGSPEIYTGTRHFLLSAGGVQRGKISQIVARPITLLMGDDVNTVDSCFYLTGAGKMKDWNNTGLCRNFACTNGTVHVPPQFTPAAERGNWKLYWVLVPGFTIITYQNNGVALMLVRDTIGREPQKQLDNVIEANKPEWLYRSFVSPDGTAYEYDLKSPKNRWVITAVNGYPTDRKFDGWERVKVEDTVK